MMLIYSLLHTLVLFIFKFKAIFYQFIKFFVIKSGLVIPFDFIRTSFFTNYTHENFKTPDHICFNILEDKVSITDLSNIIIWSSTLGVSFITIISIESIHNFLSNYLQVHLKGTKFTKQDNYYEIHLNHNKPTRVIFTHHDQAREEFVKTVKFLIDKNLDINEDVIDKTLPHSSIDYCIYFGQYQRFKGFDPWRNRSTEFLQVDSHIHLEKAKFQEILAAYSKREQRWGA